MPFPSYPLAAAKSNGTDAETDHPAHHNQLAVAVNDLQDQLDDDAAGFYPKLDDSSHATVTIVSLSTEQTLKSYTLPEDISLAGDRWVLRYAGDLLNNTGGAVTYLFRWKLGATTVFATATVSLTASASRRSWVVEIEIAVEATAAQRICGQLDIAAATAAGTWGSLDAVTSSKLAVATATEDLSSDKAAVLTVQMGTASANADCRLLFSDLIHDRTS